MKWIVARLGKWIGKEVITLCREIPISVRRLYIPFDCVAMCPKLFLAEWMVIVLDYVVDMERNGKSNYSLSILFLQIDIGLRWKV